VVPRGLIRQKDKMVFVGSRRRCLVKTNRYGKVFSGYENAEEVGPADESLPGLQSTVCVAKKVGTRLGQRYLLQ